MTRAHVGAVVDPKEIQPLIDAAVRYGTIEKPIDAGEMIGSIALRPR